MARPRRELSEAHRLQFAAHGRLVERDGELFVQPLHQIDQPPAHHAVNGRDRTSFDNFLQSKALHIVELGLWTRRLQF